jgi:hypothetical protein
VLLAVPEPIKPAVTPSQPRSVWEEFLNPSCGCKGKIARAKMLVAASAARVYWESLNEGSEETRTLADEEFFESSLTGSDAWRPGPLLVPIHTGLKILDLVASSAEHESADDAFAELGEESEATWVVFR